MHLSHSELIVIMVLVIWSIGKNVAEFPLLSAKSLKVGAAKGPHIVTSISFN